jgi:hypothetical protein
MKVRHTAAYVLVSVATVVLDSPRELNGLQELVDRALTSNDRS